MFWIREATLTIGSNKYTLDGMNFSFEVPFEDSDETPVATIKISNLSVNTRNNIKKNDTVILNAGYEGDVGSILIGKVVGLKHKQSNVDWETTLTVMPSATEILTSVINKTYTKNMKASAIVRDMLNIFGVEVSKCELTKDIIYPRGRVCKGKLKQILTEIVVKECKSRFIIRPTGQLYITASSDGIDNGLILSPENGLLRSDEEIEAIPYEKPTSTKSESKTSKKNTKKNSKDTDKDENENENEETSSKKESPKKTTKKEEKEEVPTISRSCLLNYRVAMAEVVKVQSSNLNGRYKVVSGKHTGSRTGDWKTEMELVTYDTKATKKTDNKKSTNKGDKK